MNVTWRSWSRAAVTLVLAAALYEALARSGWFAPALMPTLPKVASALVASLADGTMIGHAASTLYRVLFGLSLAVVAVLLAMFSAQIFCTVATTSGGTPLGMKMPK